MSKQRSDFQNSKPRGSPEKRVPTLRWHVVNGSMQQELQPPPLLYLYLSHGIPAGDLDEWRPAGFCRSAPGESTQVIRGNCRPMSPSAVQNVHLRAVPLHSLTHGRQPEKGARVSHPGNSRAGGRRERHAISKTGFLTLMTGFQQIPLPACSSSTWPKLPASSPMKATAGCSSQSGTHARS